MFLALFILCVVIFGYLMYVLIKPEKFEWELVFKVKR